MRLGKIAVVLFGICVCAGSAVGADRYEIDPVHTTLGFSVRHMMISNVQGKFNEFSGTLLYEEKDLAQSSVQVTIKAASIDTGNSHRDDDVRSPNFFDTAKYPEIIFKSTRIEKKGDGYVALGLLTMHGVSKEISLPFTINGKIKDPRGNEHIGIEAGLTLNRQDWGISYSRTMDNGGMMVGNDVKIELNVEAVKR